MSGGSYDYLYSAEITSRQCDIGRMADRLRELGHHDAALRTEEALAHLRAAELIQQELRNVWHDVEWIDSGDCGKGYESGSLMKWRESVSLDAERVDVARRLYELEREAARLRELVAGGAK